MKFRLATQNDLPQIKAVYRDIIDRMDESGIQIWDDVYPCEFFADDIKRGRLYVLMDGGKVAAAFALCESNSGADAVEWNDTGATALYLDRLGVSVEYARQGVGTAMLQHARDLARKRGATYLRLFVVDGNEPALNLYRKNGFEQVGTYDEVIDADLVLREWGFEKRL